MARYLKTNRYLCFALLLLCGCKEFIEPSLSGEKVELVAPAADVETSNYQLIFVWEKHEDALSYRLQVALPTFDRVERLVLDTVVRTDRFTFTLDPGSYQWRLRAQNGSSHTPYQTRAFTVHPSSLSGQIPQLENPANLWATAVPSVSFAWLPLFGATGYQLQVDDRQFVNERAVVLDQTVATAKFVHQFNREGTYQFRVRATSISENSKWSAIRTFTYDATPPAKVVLSAPVNASTVATPVGLSWTAVADAEKYEVFLYRSDGTTLVNGFPSLVSNAALSFTTGVGQESYLWRVRAIDQVGNKGSLSDVFGFTVR